MILEEWSFVLDTEARVLGIAIKWEYVLNQNMNISLFYVSAAFAGLFVCLFVCSLCIVGFARTLSSSNYTLFIPSHPLQTTYIVLSGNYTSIFGFGMYFSPRLKHYTISIIRYLLPTFLYVVSQHRYVQMFHSFASLTRNINHIVLDWMSCVRYSPQTVTVKVVLFLLRWSLHLSLKTFSIGKSLCLIFIYGNIYNGIIITKNKNKTDFELLDDSYGQIDCTQIVVRVLLWASAYLF